MDTPQKHQEQPLPTEGAHDVTGTLISEFETRAKEDPTLVPLVNRLRERQAIGIERYGRSLQTFNGRDAVRDLGEELVDGIQYLKQVELETDTLLYLLAETGLRLSRLSNSKSTDDWLVTILRQLQLLSKPKKDTLTPNTRAFISFFEETCQKRGLV